MDLFTFDIPEKTLIHKASKSNPMVSSLFRRTSMSARQVLTNLALVAVVSIGASACNKEKPTTVVITVKDADGALVPDAFVKLFANPTVPQKPDLTRLLQEGRTKSNGTVEFDYTGLYEQGQAGFAVLDIYTEKDTMFAEGIIKILEEETNAQTLILERMPD